jgi:AraC family transcriptional regulator
VINASIQDGAPQQLPRFKFASIYSGGREPLSIIRNYRVPVGVVEYNWTARHAIWVCGTPSVTPTSVEGGSFRNHAWNIGDVGLLPSRTQAVTIQSKAISGTEVSVPLQAFAEVTQGHLDLSRMELRFCKLQSPSVTQLARTMCGLLADGNIDEWPLLSESIAISLLAAVLREMSPRAKQVLSTLKDGLSIERKLRIREYVTENLSRPITLADMARVAALSPFHFSRSFKKATGKTPARYLLDRRIERAKVLLSTTKLPIADVAAQSGFSSQSHLTTVLKAETGATPMQYRKAL